MPSDFPAPLKDLILQGWSKDPTERPQLDKFKSALNKMMGDDLQKSTSEKDQPAAFQTLTFDLGFEKTEKNKLALNKVVLGDDEKKNTSFAASRTKLETFINSKIAKNQQNAFQTSTFNLGSEKTEENKSALNKILRDGGKKSTSFAASKTKLEAFMNSKIAKDQDETFPPFKSNLGVEKIEENNSAYSLSGNKDNSREDLSNLRRETPKQISYVKTPSSVTPQETNKAKKGEAKNILHDQTIAIENNFLSQTADNFSPKVQNRISLFEDMSASNTLKKANERREKQSVVEELNKAQGISQGPEVPAPPPPTLPQLLQKQHQQQAQMKTSESKPEHQNDVKDDERGIFFCLMVRYQKAEKIYPNHFAFGYSFKFMTILNNYNTITVINNLLSEIFYPSDDDLSRMKYVGHTEKGIPSGNGIMTWKNGQTYKGCLQI